jgi:lipopolysaccharide biosynthesis protein
MPDRPGADSPAEPVLVLPLAYYVIPVLPPPRIAVQLHLYHLDLTAEFQAYLQNIPCPFTLFISTDTQEKKRRIEAAFAGWTKGAVKVRTMVNRGRDIAAKLVAFRDIYEDYPLILYLHSKHSPHDGDLLNWRGFLLNCLLGSQDSVAGILETFERRADLGIVAPRSFAVIRHLLHWSNNFETCKALAESMGISIARNDPLDFPAGSMFWVRSAALRPLLGLGLKVSDFPEEEGQIDGTLAHAIERLFFHACEAAGFTWIHAGTARDIAFPEVPIIIRRPSDFEDRWPTRTMVLLQPDASRKEMNTAFKSEVAGRAPTQIFRDSP